MLDGGDEIGIRDGLTLRRGDADQRHVGKADVERLEIVQILAAVQRGDGAVGNRPKQGKMELVDVEMQDVEFVRQLPHAVEHQHVVGNRVADIGVEAQGHRYAGDHVALDTESPLANSVTS